ncbi:sensor histidine kinase [Paenibacillus sepulcri]|uniref:histidine kinase n=1 Tax=Paenibacillus sepulcri TaxID=359917 RepID=A0ABS7C758_9BACL|nr:histidine kinase [Paenibacillus sepulcri]
MLKKKRRLNMAALTILLLCILIPVLLQGYVLGKNAVHRTETIYDQSLSKNMESLSLNLDFYINHINDYIRILSQDEQLYQIMQKQYASQDKQIRAIRDRVNSFTKMYRLRVPLDVQIISSSGRVYGSVPLHDTESESLKRIVSSFPWYGDNIPYDNDVMYNDVADDFHDLTNDHSLYFTKNIVSGTKPLGLLVVAMRESLIQGLLNQLQLNNSTLVFIGNSSGDVLVAGENADTGQDARNVYRQAIVQAQANGGEYSSFHMDLNHRTYLCSTHNIPFLSWYLVSMTPMNMLVGQAKALWMYTLAVTAFSIVLILLILQLLTRKVMLPILNLSKRVRKLRFNDPEKLAEEQKNFRYRGIDEIEILFSGFQHMLGRIGEQMEKIKTDEQEKMNLKLTLLQSQINPHFMHNAINSIRWMAVMKGEKSIAQALVNLSGMLHYCLDKALSVRSTLGEELAYVRNYIAFQENRMLQPIETDISAESEVLHTIIPKLTLQPIVENAILHGFAGSGSFRISLTCVRHGEYVTVTVTDNGVGMDALSVKKLIRGDPVKGQSSGSGIGLMNIQQRLRLEYNDRFDIRIDSLPGQGTSVVLTIPYVICERGESA